MDNVDTLFTDYARTRDPQLRDRLVEMHQRLVCYLASKFTNGGASQEDLIQAGTMGLIHAVDLYETAEGIKFSTDATPTIVREIRCRLNKC